MQVSCESWTDNISHMLNILQWKAVFFLYSYLLQSHAYILE